MNNGKVRIYELSKELNLDNKDILAVCEQLNIAVKSHSSTISESDAERIRAYAEKHVTNHSPSPKSASSPKAKLSIPEAGGPLKKKQQILEIRKHLTSNGTTAANPNSASGSQSPLRLNPPNRPVNDRPAREATESEMTEKSILIQSQSNTPQSEPELEPSAQSEAVPPARDESALIGPPDKLTELQNQSSPERAAAPAPTPPQAVEPQKPELQAEKPVRKDVEAQPPRVERPVTATSSVSKPILKRPKTTQDSETTEAPTGAQAEVTLKREPLKKINRAPSRSEGEPERAAKAPSVPELRRPRPIKAEAGADLERPAKASPGDEPEIEEIEDPLTDLDLKRPTPPKPPKRLKKREEEEEEEELLKTPKVGKAATKAKRRPLVIDDEDEDLDDDLDDENAAAEVSLSLMRPAKPKSASAATKAPAAAPRSAPKRPGTQDNSRAARRDRRDQPKQERPEKISLTGGITVRELANQMAVQETEIVRLLFLKGIAATVTQTLDLPTVTLVAQELGIEVETKARESEARKVTEMLDADDLENLQRRPPVVTIMGHVDHGKTTLLDSIRKTKVAAGEAGGITQHIGAYHVDLDHAGETQQIVFLDTPGHEAFTAMRARGARVTDIAILVVAADDGVRPQTIEAISHAKAAEVPIVVAINKVDKEGAQPDRVRQELTEYGLVAEEWGGETIMVPVSAINGENLDTLLEMILLVSEVEELSANPDRAARGTVIEANLDKSRGPVATLLVQNGTLRVGDILVAGAALGKVRAMVDDRGKRVDVASPSFAVEVLGLSDVPAAGDEFEVFEDEKQAKAIASERANQQRESRLQQAMASRRVTLNTLSARAQEGELKELNLVLKADVQGSVEAILGSLKQLPQNEVQVRVLLAAPGEITETDVDLAAASSAVIIGFNTTLATGARSAADEAGVDVREYDVIYQLLDDIQGAMEGLLDPEMVEEPLGQVEVRAVFPVGKGAVAGCYVLSGKAIRNCNARVRRQGTVIYEGTLDSLKRMKDDAKEVNAGFECGIGIDKFNDWKESDIIETFRMVTKRRTLSHN